MLSWIINMEAISMTLPVITAVVYRESTGFIYLGIAVACGLLGFLCIRKKSCAKMSSAGEGFMTVSLGWIVLSFFGCIPSVISGEIPYIIDTVSEIVSGLTTTGFNIIPKVEDTSHAILMQRSFSHWTGSMGILVFTSAILPMTGDYNMYIMKAESPGPFMGKLMPKIRITAKLPYSTYFCITIAMTIPPSLRRMPLFDSIYMSLEATDTEGFACRSSGQADYAVYQQTIIAIFMLLFGVNFDVYYLLLARGPKDMGWCEGLRGYLAVVTIATLLVTINTQDPLPPLSMAFRQVVFQVPPIIATTGYSTIDYNSWPEFFKTILLLTMSIGACVGSMGGGMRASRVMIAFKEIKKEMASVIHSRSVKMSESEGRLLEYNILRSLDAYIIVYFIIFGISILIVSLDDYDSITSFSAAVANSNNIGPDVSVTGPSSNHSVMSYLSKTVLIFDMLAGRLELFPMLVLLSPGTWKRG